MPESDKNFQTVEEAWFSFRRNALSDFTPPKVLKTIEGGFFAGAQAMLTLMAEAAELTPDDAPEKVHKLFAEVQAFFITAKAAADTRMQEKDDGKKKRS